MNDFTKEELRIILFWGLDRVLDRVKAVGIENFKEEDHMELFHKLQDMIVNYCAHKWEEFSYNNIRCKKCGKDIWYE